MIYFICLRIALNVELSKEDLDAIDALFPPSAVIGDRYGDPHLTYHGNH